MCENDEQLDEAKSSIARIEAGADGAVQTEIALGKPFHPAEDYHQKWKLRQHRDVFVDLARNYANEAQLLRSVAATKLNALVAGHLAASQIERDLARFGLSAKGIAALRSLVPRRLRA